VLAAVCVKVAADAFADVYCGLWQKYERMSMVGWVLSLNAVASIAFMALAAALRGGVAVVAAGAALGSCVAFAFVHVCTALDPELRAHLARGPALEWRRIARLARESTPLGVILLLGSLQVNVPRYFVQHDGGEVALGLFAAAYQLTSAGTIVVQALGGGAAPRLARAAAAGDVSAFSAFARKLVLGAAGLGVLGVATSLLVGKPVLEIVFRAEFGAAAGVLVVLSAAAGVGFVATLLGYALTAARVITVQPLLLSASLAVATAGCAVLVPAYGAEGAAWALVLGSLVQAIWSAIALKRHTVRAAVQGAAPVEGA
jgi:O-antigen/teichoic acid export membrane protein